MNAADPGRMNSRNANGAADSPNELAMNSSDPGNGGSDLIKLAMVRIDRLLAGKQSKLLLQVLTTANWCWNRFA